MPIIARKTGGNFIPAPAGTHPAVCVDVVDLGMVKNSFDPEKPDQHKIRVVWQLDKLMPDGKPFLIGKRYTLSLHERASLRKDLETWRGQPFTEQQITGYDVEKVIGVGALLAVVRVDKGDEAYANVAAIMRLPTGMHAPPAHDYIRVKDRPKDSEGVPMASGPRPVPPRPPAAPARMMAPPTPPEPEPEPQEEYSYAADDSDVPF